MNLLETVKGIFKRDEPFYKYRIMEVESELESNKDLLIAELRDHVSTLERLVKSLEYQILNFQKNEEPVQDSSQPIRRKVSTVSELATIMEAASLARKRKNDEKNNPKHTS